MYDFTKEYRQARQAESAVRISDKNEAIAKGVAVGAD
jgi:hypothetical protein